MPLFFYFVMVYQPLLGGELSTARPNIIVVKVHRNAAGHLLPFDKLYFFRREDRDLIPKIFGYALVLPIDEQLVSALYALRPKMVSHRKFRRDDEALQQEPVIAGDLLDGRKHSDNQIKDWWDAEVINKYDLEERVAVVPILTSKVRQKLYPRYLSSQKWFNRQTRSNPRYQSGRNRRLRVTRDLAWNVTAEKTINPAISELAYLATPQPAPNDKIRPICTVCPRILLHLQGECLPGQLVCYKSLNLNNIVAESTASTPHKDSAAVDEAEGDTDAGV